MLGAEEVEEVLDEQHHVLPSVPQCGDVEFKNAESIVEVVSKLLFIHVVAQIPVGCSDHTDIHIHLSRSPDR